MAAAGPETWTVNDAPIAIAGTRYERAPHDTIRYVIDFHVRSAQDLFGLSEDQAIELAWPVFKYAFVNRTYERTRFHPLRGTESPPIRIVVNLLPPEGEKTVPYPVELSSGAIEWRISQGR